MQVVWRLSAFAHEQPDPLTWDALAAITGRFDTGVPWMRLGVVDTAEERDELAARLATVPGAVFTLAQDASYDASDLATADYVAVFPREERLRVAQPDALVATGPCPGCGLEDSFDVTQRGPFVITRGDTDGDTSALPGGGMAVSTLFVGVLSDVAATGWSTEDIVDGESGRASETWSQLVANRAVLVPCEHTEVDGNGFCAHCGRALGTSSGVVRVSCADLAEEDVVARHPGRRAMFYLSRRVLDALAAAGVGDLILGDPLSVCRRHRL
jgi:hypothetical protein